MASAALSTSDALLLEGVMNGDQRAFEALFVRYHDKIYNILFRLLGSRNESEDVLQEVFLKLFQHPFRSGGEHNLSAWLYKVALNEGYNHIRAENRRSNREDRAQQMNDRDLTARQMSQDPAQEALLKEKRLVVRSVLQDLSERHRSCLVLRATGFSYAEIAQVLEVAPGSVGTLLARAEESFRVRYVALNREGGSQ